MKKHATKRKAALALLLAIATGTAVATPAFPADSAQALPASAIEAGHADAATPEFFSLRLDKGTLVVAQDDGTQVARMPVGTLSKKIQIADCAAEISFGRNPSKELFAVLVPDAKNPRRLSFTANKRHFETQPPVGQTPVLLSLLFPEQDEERLAETGSQTAPAFSVRLDGDMLVLTGADGAQIARIPVGTVSRSIRIGNDYVTVSFTRDNSNVLQATIVADGANAHTLAFTALNRRYELQPGVLRQPITLTLSLDDPEADLASLDAMQALPPSAEQLLRSPGVGASYAAFSTDPANPFPSSGPTPSALRRNALLVNLSPRSTTPF